MKKSIIGILICWLFGISSVFAQSMIPDTAQIEVKSPIIQWEATNLKVSLMRNWSVMTSYTGTILMIITEENGNILNQNEYIMPNRWMYTFLPADLWSKEFQKGLEVKKDWTFYIEISDLNDLDDNILWKQQIQVVKNNWTQWNYHIDILSPVQNATLTNEKVEILWHISDLPNSNVIIYIDNTIATATITDSNGLINAAIPNISEWSHSLRVEISDIEWNILWTSDTIYFTYKPQKTTGFKSINIDPENWLMVGDLVNVTVYTDEMVESVKMKLSDRSENDSIIMTKNWNGEFSQKIFLIASWDIDISIETSAANNSSTEMFNNVKTIKVSDSPEISDVKVETDWEIRKASITRSTINGSASSYLINYRVWDKNNATLSGQESTNTESFEFTDVPYDTTISLEITPYRENNEKHWAASKTITFLITKPLTTCGNWVQDAWETCQNCPQDLWSKCSTTSVTINANTWAVPKCTVQNIKTRTKKIWDSYYLVWNKVENVSKYIVYSSPNADGSNKIKVYETSDTSYEYPFDRTSEEDVFMYFWIVGICDDWEVLQLTWATKVQVWPAENFFLLVCLTLLVYFWIKLFRQTEE